MEDIGGLPEFLQGVHQIEDQCDFEFLLNSNLESTLAVSQGNARDRNGSRRSISSATSWITAVFPLSRLAHTRLFSGRGGGGASPDAGREVGKRLSMTC